jgi:NAD(P)-dependent dehydrogenase (short-subunit alcohol dehydrogenase family)
MSASAGGPNVSAGSPVSLVTGGANGIGAAVVRQLADRGERVVVVDRDRAAGESVAAEVNGCFVPADLRDPDASERAVAAAEDAFGRLDHVHLNAGIQIGVADPTQVDIDTYQTAVEINQNAVFYGVRASVPSLRRHGGGAIVATASLAGLVAYPDDPIYAMTKHAVVGLVRALAPRLATEGIRVGCVCPGFADTDLFAPYRQRFLDAGFPLLDPGDVASAVLLAFDDPEPGRVWCVQPGREPVPYRFSGVPGPRVGGEEGIRPPTVR